MGGAREMIMKKGVWKFIKRIRERLSDGYIRIKGREMNSLEGR